MARIVDAAGVEHRVGVVEREVVRGAENGVGAAGDVLQELIAFARGKRTGGIVWHGK